MEAQMLYITTSNGVYRYSEKTGKFSFLIRNRHTPGLFRKRAKGYFGICYHDKTNQLILASRERLGTPEAGKKTTDTGLHVYDQKNMRRTDYHEVLDAHDIHQIASTGDLVFLTDTGKNRVHVYDLAQRKTVHILNIGDQRRDVNHVNAVHADQSQLLIGLNNSKLGNSQVVRLEMDYINNLKEFEIDAFSQGEIRTPKGVQHTHDIEPVGDDLWACASSDGNLINLDDGRVLKHIGDWARGITVGDKYVYVGTSGIASRFMRHITYKSARVFVLEPGSLELVKEIVVPRAGQLNDMVWEKEE